MQKKRFVSLKFSLALSIVIVRSFFLLLIIHALTYLLEVVAFFCFYLCALYVGPTADNGPAAS